MKRIFLVLFAFMQITLFAQVQVINKELQLNTVNLGSLNDYLLVRGLDKKVKTIPISSIQGGSQGISEAPLNGINYVRKNASWQPLPVLEYKEYFINFSQSGTSNPNVYVSGSNVGETITWIRYGLGSYYFTVPTNLFLGTYTSRVYVNITNVASYGNFPAGYFTRKVVSQVNGNGMGGMSVFVLVFDNNNNPIDLDGSMNIEIKFLPI
jgi:hypothetical protein